MEKILLWGCGNVGRQAYEELFEKYEVIAFGDNDKYKQGLIYKGIRIISFEELAERYPECAVVVSMQDYYGEAKKLSENNINVLGYYDAVQRRVLPWRRISWEDIRNREEVRLYAGDIYSEFERYPDDYVVCLSLVNSNYRCIQHDITLPYPLADNNIDSYQIEDVLEHIDKNKALSIINEIYRILKRGGYLRMSLPDYNSPFMLHNSFVNDRGNPVYDPGGGGRYVNGKVCEGGHVWFPTYEIVKEMLEKSNFKNIKFYRYHDAWGNVYSQEIDYEKGYISRVKENISYHEDISIVVDCYK